MCCRGMSLLYEYRRTKGSSRTLYTLINLLMERNLLKMKTIVVDTEIGQVPGFKLGSSLIIQRRKRWRTSPQV